MKVDRLLILTLLHSQQRTSHKDDFLDGAALAVKHVRKQLPESQRDSDVDLKKWEAIANSGAYDVAGFSASQIGAHNAYVVLCKDGKLAADPGTLKGFFGDAKTCGVYVLVHGRGGMTTPYKETVKSQSPEAIANMIRSLVPKKIELTKVNLVACTLATKLDSSQSDSATRNKFTKQFVDEKKGVENFVAALCRELDRKETMVAGYKVPVYVVRDNNTEFTTPGVDGDDRPKGATIGQKAATLQSNQPTRMVRDDRGTAKTVYQLGGDGVRTVPIDEYHAYGS